MPRLGLSMIVKDEAPVIERCLRSVLPLLDWWVVADTGSTDGTQEIVRSVLGDLPGELISRPWVDFGHNRQESLQAARDLEHSRPDDYVLWIDADDSLADLPVTLPALTADGYHLLVLDGDSHYPRLHLVRLDLPWRWTGVVHEYLELPGARLGSLEAPRVVRRREGVRSRDPETFRMDAALIDRELARTPDDPRLQFYLGQSWRDAGEPELALAAYRRRAANPHGWDQERWYALFQAAACLERLGGAAEEVTEAYLAAYAARPSRAEPLVELARFERERERYSVAILYAEPATRLPMPPADDLFVHRDVYTWRAWDELAVSCYWTGRYAQGLAAAERALAVRPDDERLRTNLAFLRDRTS